MKLKFQKKLLLAKIETEYGVDSEPTGALNAILTRNLEITPLTGETLERELDKPYLGADLASLVGKHVTCSFSVEMAGAGDAGDVPAYGPLLRGCGYAQEIVEEESVPVAVRYYPVDDEADQGALSMYITRGGVKLYKMVGSRGSLTIELAKRQYGYFRFSFMGLFLPVTELAEDIAGVFSAFVKPTPFRATTVEASILGNTVGLHRLTVNGGQQVAFYEHSEEESLQIEDRNGSFEAVIEDTNPEDIDWIGEIDDETTGALACTLGATAGNIVEVNSPLIQLLAPSETNENGIMALQLNGPLVADGEDPDHEIIVR